MSACVFYLYFLMIDDVGHLFMCLLAIHIYSLVKCSKLLPIFKLDVFTLSFENSLLIMDTSSLLDICFKSFPPSL